MNNKSPEEFIKEFEDMVRDELSVAVNSEAFLDRKDVSIRDVMMIIKFICAERERHTNVGLPSVEALYDWLARPNETEGLIVTGHLTSPLEVYAWIKANTRQVALPSKEQVETWCSGNSRTRHEYESMITLYDYLVEKMK